MKSFNVLRHPRKWLPLSFQIHRVIQTPRDDITCPWLHGWQMAALGFEPRHCGCLGHVLHYALHFSLSLNYWLLVGGGGGREKERERERHRFVVLPTDAFIGSFLYVPWLEDRTCNLDVLGQHSNQLGYPARAEFLSSSYVLGWHQWNATWKALGALCD